MPDQISNTELQTVNEKALAVTGEVNAFAAAGSALTGSALPILKMSKSGEWISGTANTPVEETRFAADVRGAQVGFVCFVDGEVVGEAMAPVASGKQITQDDLEDHGPYQSDDGWQDSASIQLRSVETGEEYLFKPTSHGGRSAIGALLQRYGYRLNAGQAGLPIIDCVVTSYKHKKYGTVFKPKFVVIEWRDEAELARAASSSTEELLNDAVPF